MQRGVGVILKPFFKVWKVAIIDDGLMQELNDLPKCKLWLFLTKRSSIVVRGYTFSMTVVL